MRRARGVVGLPRTGVVGDAAVEALVEPPARGEAETAAFV